MTSISRRQVEELMLKLLFDQINKTDIQIMINLFQPNPRQPLPVDIETYFNNHISKFCIKHHKELINKVQSIDQKNYVAFQTALSRCIYDSLNTIRNNLRKEIHSKIESDLNKFLYIYLEKTYENLKQDIHFRNSRYLFELIQIPNPNIQSKVAQFLIAIYNETKDSKKDLLINIFLNEIENICIYSTNMNERECLRLLIKEYDRKGTPFLDKKRLSKKRSYVFEIEKLNSNQSIICIPESSSVYELLIQIMIQENINIDLYDVILANNQFLLTVEHYRIIIAESDLFKIEKNIITLKEKTNYQLFLYYFDNNYCFKQRLKDLLLQLFETYGNNRFAEIPINKFFAFIKDPGYKTFIYTLFQGIINYEKLIIELEKKNEDHYRLLHLLFGFQDASPDYPYLRNILKKNCLTTRIKCNYKNANIQTFFCFLENIDNVIETERDTTTLFIYNCIYPFILKQLQQNYFDVKRVEMSNERISKQLCVFYIAIFPQLQLKDSIFDIEERTFSYSKDISHKIYFWLAKTMFNIIHKSSKSTKEKVFTQFIEKMPQIFDILGKQQEDIHIFSSILQYIFTSITNQEKNIDSKTLINKIFDICVRNSTFISIEDTQFPLFPKMINYFLTKEKEFHFDTNSKILNSSLNMYISTLLPLKNKEHDNILLLLIYFYGALFPKDSLPNITGQLIQKYETTEVEDLKQCILYFIIKNNIDISQYPPLVNSFLSKVEPKYKLLFAVFLQFIHVFMLVDKSLCDYEIMFKFPRLLQILKQQTKISKEEDEIINKYYNEKRNVQFLEVFFSYLEKNKKTDIDQHKDIENNEFKCIISLNNKADLIIVKNSQSYLNDPKYFPTGYIFIDKNHKTIFFNLSLYKHWIHQNPKPNESDNFHNIRSGKEFKYYEDKNFEDITPGTPDVIAFYFYIRNEQKDLNIKNNILSFYSHYFDVKYIKYPYVYLDFFASASIIYSQNKGVIECFYCNWIKQENITVKAVTELKTKYKKVEHLKSFFNHLISTAQENENKNNIVKGRISAPTDPFILID